MIIQVSANGKIIGGVEVYEDNGEIFIINETETLSFNEYGNTEEINTILNSNDDVLDIDLDDDGVFFTHQEFKAFRGCEACYVEFETDRNNSSLGIHDDWEATLRIIAPLKIYHIIGDKEYNTMLKKVNSFFDFDGKFCNAEEYTYEELDEFIVGLHPLLRRL